MLHFCSCLRFEFRLIWLGYCLINYVEFQDCDAMFIEVLIFSSYFLRLFRHWIIVILLRVIHVMFSAKDVVQLLQDRLVHVRGQFWGFLQRSMETWWLAVFIMRAYCYYNSLNRWVLMPLRLFECWWLKCLLCRSDGRRIVSFNTTLWTESGDTWCLVIVMHPKYEMMMSSTSFESGNSL